MQGVLKMIRIYVRYGVVTQRIRRGALMIFARRVINENTTRI